MDSAPTLGGRPYADPTSALNEAPQYIGPE